MFKYKLCKRRFFEIILVNYKTLDPGNGIVKRVRNARALKINTAVNAQMKMMLYSKSDLRFNTLDGDSNKAFSAAREFQKATLFAPPAPNIKSGYGV